MQIKLIRDIVSSIVGNSASSIVDLLYNKKNVNEFLIAKKLKLTINQTRNVLYRLADEGIVSFVRKKDSKKGGWYTYFWTLNSGRSLHKFKETLNKSIDQIREQVSIKKSGRFYVCPNCRVEYNEENSLLHGYTCPECGEVLILKDNSNEVIGLEKDMNKLVSVLAEVNLELEAVDKKEGVARNRRIKSEEKKKKAERAAKRKKRISDNKKAAKKNKKKSAKKKGK